MKFASIVSARPSLSEAIRETIAGVEAELEVEPDLVFIFASSDHAERYDEIPEQVARAFPRAVVAGCSARSVLGAGRELEDRPGLSLIAGLLPGVELQAFHLDPASGRAPRELFPADPDASPHFVLLADPFTGQSEQIVQLLDTAFPSAVKVGGIASGGLQPGEDALFLGERTHRRGIVGVAISGDVEIDPIVAQGCRPIGQPLFVTRHEGNRIDELDGKPAVELLRALFAGLEPRDRELFRNSLFVGIVMRGDQTEYLQGDFLIRNLVGMDPEGGAIAVAADLSQAHVIQFHLRDARTSAQDLDACLTRYARAARATDPSGALLFSCLGRGEGLYGEPDHDSRLFASRLGELPLGGFFCNGEIGPVGDRTYLHGYTSSFAIFRPARRLS